MVALHLLYGTICIIILVILFYFAGLLWDRIKTGHFDHDDKLYNIVTGFIVILVLIVVSITLIVLGEGIEYLINNKL